MPHRAQSRRFLIVVWTLGLALTVTACVGSKTTECSWGAVCPAGQICYEQRSLCVYPSQLDQCENQIDTHPCDSPGAEPGTHMCQQEVCLPKPICGNGLVETYETCDGTILGDTGDLTCVDMPGGFTGGVLACDNACALDTRRCSTCGNAQCEPEETLDSCPADCSAVNVSAGNAHTCITLVDGTARCWGVAEDGQLGNLSGDDEPTPQPVYGITTAVDISAGAFITCTLLDDARVRCFGDNSDGALGDGLSEHYDCGGYDCGPAPVPVAGLDTATQVAAGNWHVCALLADTSVRCWGDNEGNQLGDATVEDRFTPTAVHDLTGVVHIAAGFSHSCAVLATGGVSCWGFNEEGCVGDGTSDPARVPVQVLDVADAGQVGAGDIHSCALLNTGQVRCWGHNYFGQLGNGGTETSLVAITVTGIQNATKLTVGARHACVILTNGTVGCWGGNGSGQIGDGTINVARTPVAVEGLADVIDISAGGFHTCALTRDGALWCWGANDVGQLGIGSYTDSLLPARVLSWNGSREFDL